MLAEAVVLVLSVLLAGLISRMLESRSAEFGERLVRAEAIAEQHEARLQNLERPEED